jgi:hypothetical protein
LTVDSDTYLELSKRIWQLREKFKITKDCQTKYLPAPAGLTNDDYMKFKKECIQVCIELNCRFYTYQILHDIAADTDQARRNGINEICLNFHYGLKKEDAAGMILVDRFNDKGNKIDAHLTRKFSVGLEGLPHSSNFPLDHIVGLHYTAIGQSHMTCLIDIILGSYRTAINIYTRKRSQKYALANEILTVLSPLFLRGTENCIPRVAISFSPLQVNVSKYRKSYNELISEMNKCGYELAQQYPSA